jgi:hypothetical protein
MPGKLMKFLCELAVESKKFAEYQRDPELAMQNAGLDDEERAALMSGDPLKVHAALVERATGQGVTRRHHDFWGPNPE